MKKIKLIILLLLFLANLCIFTGCKKNKNEYTINDLENAINNLNDNFNSSNGNYTFKIMYYRFSDESKEHKQFEPEVFFAFFLDKDKDKDLALNCDQDLYLQKNGNTIKLYETDSVFYENDWFNLMEYYIYLENNEDFTDFNNLLNSNTWEYHDKIDKFVKNFCSLLETSNWEHIDRSDWYDIENDNISISIFLESLGLPQGIIPSFISIIQNHKKYFNFENGVFVGNAKKINEELEEYRYDMGEDMTFFNVKLHKNDSNGMDLALIFGGEYQTFVFEFSNIGTTTIDGLFSK